ncbi:MAG: Na+/H+ antiporter NhaC family protein, partial [Polyangia bacterium]|nr:Na+/H+ antiporter NhaC family protein [Polyangia bacterium]
GLFQTTVESLGLDISGFELFFEALPMRFYCLLMLFFVLATTLLGRDYGPMLRAERRARRQGATSSLDGDPSSPAAPIKATQDEEFSPSWVVAALPILVVIAGVLGGILLLGHLTEGVRLGLAEGLYAPLSFSHFRECFSFAAKDSLQGWALLGAGLAGSLLALILAAVRRNNGARRSLGRALGSLSVTWLRGAGVIGGAVGILVGAWAIQAACDALGTQVVLTAALAGAVDPTFLPLIIFLTASGISFATGTSWGTMGILIPAVLPIAHALGGAEHPVLLYLSAGAVLDGAIFGDHCSPISDTTVMSSLSSGCPHLDHLRTQLPYALTVMVAAALGGYLARAAGTPLWACYGISAAALLAVLLALGRRP